MCNLILLILFPYTILILLNFLFSTNLGNSIYFKESNQNMKDTNS